MGVYSLCLIKEYLTALLSISFVLSILHVLKTFDV